MLPRIDTCEWSSSGFPGAEPVHEVSSVMDSKDSQVRDMHLNPLQRSGWISSFNGHCSQTLTMT